MNTRKTLAILALLAVVPLAAAQGYGGPPAGQGGPPPGGPPRQGPMAGPRGPMMGPAGPRLLLHPDVQKELKLSDEQKQKLGELLRPMGPAGPGAPGRPGGPGGAPSRPPVGGPPGGGPPAGGPPGSFGGPGGAGPGGQGRPGMEQEIDGKLKSILSSGQFARYQEISLQQQGPMALGRPDVAEKVDLSDAQRQQIRGILMESRESMPRPEPGAHPDPEAMRKRMEAHRKQTDEKILAVLNRTQLSKWNALLGQPFKLNLAPPSPPRPPGGGG
ncbi:MAG TPA: hypothetical protein VM328_03540 [Fimbriimonadaceae bacterium]|nr:hypothetical protein [Fimbriimonadaceae bacterium]